MMQAPAASLPHAMPHDDACASFWSLHFCLAWLRAMARRSSVLICNHHDAQHCHIDGSLIGYSIAISQGSKCTTDNHRPTLGGSVQPLHYTLMHDYPKKGEGDAHKERSESNNKHEWQ